MMKISALVTEKKIHEVLWALNGLIVGKPEVDLISGATVINGQAREIANVKKLAGGLKSQKMVGARMFERVVKDLISQGKDEVTIDDLKNTMVKLGGSIKSNSSIYYLRNTAISHGVIKATKSGTFKIHANKLPKEPEV